MLVTNDVLVNMSFKAQTPKILIEEQIDVRMM